MDWEEETCICTSSEGRNVKAGEEGFLWSLLLSKCAHLLRVRDQQVCRVHTFPMRQSKWGETQDKLASTVKDNSHSVIDLKKQSYEASFAPGNGKILSLVTSFPLLLTCTGKLTLDDDVAHSDEEGLRWIQDDGGSLRSHRHTACRILERKKAEVEILGSHRNQSGVHFKPWWS